MSEALAQRADTLRVDVPRDVWRRGKRPFRGLFFRASLALTFVLVGFAMPTLQLTVALIAFGVIIFSLTPVFTDSRLSSVENEVQWADRSQATKLLETLEQRRLVALFAPFAWVELQKGRLHLRLGDGRGAARAFAEAARLCGQPEQPALLGAQAHGLTLSGDRKEAQTLLRKLEKRGALTPYDRLHLGINLIEEGRAKQAVEHLDDAVEVLDRHPRALAALALALAKTDRMDEAADVFERAEAIDDLDDDVLAPDLLKRARKALRGAEGAKGATRRAADKPAGGPAKAKTRKSEKRRKKDKRKERRERRKGRGKGDERGATVEPIEPEGEGARKPAEPEPAKPKDELPTVELAKGALPKGEPEPEPEPKPEPAKPKDELPTVELPMGTLPKGEPEPAPKPAAAAPKPAAVVFEGTKPVFRPPSIPPPPVLKSQPTRPGGPAPPKIGQAAPKAPQAAPATSKSSETASDDDWGDVLGDDATPLVPVPAKKRDD